MSSTPTSVYFLLANPTWLSKPVQAKQIAAGLRNWEFDPNEQHDNTSVLRALLQGCSVFNVKEADLMGVVRSLLDAGAQPESAFLGTHSSIQWNKLPGVKRMLTQAMMPGTEVAAVDPLGEKIFALLRELNSPDAIVARIQIKLGEKGLQERLDGLNAGAWVALHAARAGESLPGWCIPHQSHGSDGARIVRTARKAVVEAKLLQAGTPLERVIAAFGMAAAVMDISGSMNNAAARDAALNTCRKLVQGLDVPGVLAEAATGPTLSREQKSRLGIAMLQTTVFLVPGEDPWSVVVNAWPLVQDLRLEVHSAARKLVGEHGFPTRMLDQIEPTPHNQQLLMDFLAAGLHRFAPQTAINIQERAAFFEALPKWRQGQGLPHFDREQLWTRVGRANEHEVLRHEVNAALDAVELCTETPASQLRRAAGPRL